jgi:putative serine protease PepD
MTSSLLTPPTEQWSPPPPQTPRRRTGPLAALLVTAALLGGATSAGVLVATGATRGGTTTTIQRAASTSSGGMNASALYASTAAGVVDITAKSSSTASATPFGGAPQQSGSTATGTGFVVDTNGHIVTAAHVVDGASSVSVKLQDGTTRAATVLGKDDATDIAVLKIDASGLTLHPLKLGSSSAIDVGTQVAAIGDPFGYARSLSTGIISGVDRTIQAPNGFTVAHAIQTDAAVNPGNSGGPVLDTNGNVIGIVDQIATDGSAQQSSGVGFAVPIDLVKSSLKTLDAGGQVKHAYLGVSTADGSSTTTGATVSSVAAGGPAAGGGLRAGDIVTAFDGTSVGSSTDLVAAIATHQPGDHVQLTVRRGSSTQHLTVTLGTQPTQAVSNGG